LFSEKDLYFVPIEERKSDYRNEEREAEQAAVDNRVLVLFSQLLQLNPNRLQISKEIQSVQNDLTSFQDGPGSFSSGFELSLWLSIEGFEGGRQYCRGNRTLANRVVKQNEILPLFLMRVDIHKKGQGTIGTCLIHKIVVTLFALYVDLSNRFMLKKL
jgi:hypothetical protein